MAENRLCSCCAVKIAEFFCTCTDPETFLCDEHQLKHTRTSAGGHTIWPLSQLPHYKNPGYLLRLKAFPRVREEATGCVWQVEKAIAELTASVDEMKAALSAFCVEKVRELQEIKANLQRDISLALEETERTLTENEPLLSTRYGPLLRDRTEKAAPLQLFSFTLETRPAHTFLSVTSKLTNPQDLLLPAKFAGVFNNRAFLYDIDTQEFTRCTLSINFGGSGSYVQLDKNRLLCVGAKNASDSVYVLELPSFQLNALPSLCIARKNAGLGKVEEHVYVFGGDNGKVCLRSCEKMQISSQRWTEMSSMTYTRSAFTPCHFCSLIYLVGATDKIRAVETFDPVTEIFAVLPVSLPLQLSLNQCSVAFVFNEKLCLLTQGKQMACWKINTETEFRLSSTEKVIWSNQQPLIVGSMALIAHGGGVKLFSLETYSEVRFLN